MSRLTRPYHHGNLRAVLIQAALELLESSGAATLSLREVARRAGVSHNAPYHHFGDRAGLLEAAGQEAMRRFLDAQRAAYDAERGAVDALIAMGEAYAVWALAHPGAFEVIYDPEICAPGSPSPGMAPLIAENEELLARAVDAAFPEAAPHDRSALESALWATVHGLAVLATAGHLPSAAIRPALRAVVRSAGAV